MKAQAEECLEKCRCQQAQPRMGKEATDGKKRCDQAGWQKGWRMTGARVDTPQDQEVEGHRPKQCKKRDREQ